MSLVFSKFVQYAMMPVVATKCLLFTVKRKEKRMEKVLVLKSVSEHLSCMRMEGVVLCTKIILGFTHCRGPTASQLFFFIHSPLQIFPLASVRQTTVNSSIFSVIQKKKRGKKQPYSISACSDNFVMCNSCSVCNAMH